MQSLGDAFLAQPKDVMDSVQRLRLLAQQTEPYSPRRSRRSRPDKTCNSENDQQRVDNQHRSHDKPNGHQD